MADTSTERFDSYDEDLLLLLTEITSALQEATSATTTSANRQASLSKADRACDEARELVGALELELQNIPTAGRTKLTHRVRERKLKLEQARRSWKQAKDDAASRDLFGARGDDRYGETEADGAAYAQRNRLLAGHERLDNASARLQNSQRLANETEGIGAGILRDLSAQGEQIRNTRERLMQADGYVDKSMKSLKSMGRRLITNKIITGTIIAVLILLILLVIYSKFK
ncbi:snare region anchored in the vesicle membrane C-terminus-domain-containing protein [Protomyces lactucae-debilis]|uniref:Snare region anchored in the vesicle membrane C-terminus-domain-containing protein n=1 Tax=Protomyces lactucae-debilis TaxID=2754530 RepID=A0A1Y2FAR7_PROLT|nr:snare region anchored in the vesicle membrane C-terminus-domain-containing protein [Protomyces lactucae-debilis]ORY79955.1 snare region anchored in the vesicle membrane C-terminus-domain-containing protein [Protomyces lactucae-debilis]